ncbi:MAG TPA: hypothetical protein PKE55_05425 [Kiritimatiellia bacterium]|nr:hypothetical protein [Kiritimatiellia bacterium]
MNVVDGKAYVPIFSFAEGIGESFLSSVQIENPEGGALAFGDLTVQLELFRLYENEPSGIDSILRKSDAAMILVKFLDRMIMDRIKETYRILAEEAFLPKSICICREAKEAEFKISCAYCGQKLWVRDKDAGKRGNCPQCRKTFFLPTQKSYLTSFLMLTDAVPAVTVTLGDATCTNALSSLIERVVSHEQGLKSSTMRVQIPPDELG